MRKIKLVEWNIDGAKPGEKDKEDLAQVLQALMKMIPVQNMPRGFDQFRTFNKIHKAFDNAEKSRELILEDAEYSFIKNLVTNFIPAHWSILEKRMEEMEKFMNLEAEQ